MTSMERVPTNESGFLRLSVLPSLLHLFNVSPICGLSNQLYEEFEQDVFSLSGYYGGYFFLV